MQNKIRASTKHNTREENRQNLHISTFSFHFVPKPGIFIFKLLFIFLMVKLSHSLPTAPQMHGSNTRLQHGHGWCMQL